MRARRDRDRSLLSTLRASAERILAVMRKETIQRWRDKRTLILIVSVPFIQLFLFGYAVNLTADHIPTAVADMSMGARSRDFVDAMEVSGFFEVQRYLGSEAEVLRAIDRGEVRAGIVIPPDFDTRVEAGTSQVLIILDGSDSFSVQSGYSAAVAIAQAHALEVISARVERVGGRLQTMPIRSSSRVLYNPNRDDMIFVMPGLIAMLLQVLAVNITAQSIVREAELGLMEQLLVTPLRPLELVLGKLIPSVGLVVFDMIIITLFGVFWFGVPFRGSLWLFGWLSLLFIIAGLGLGLLISTVAHTQRETEQLTTLLMLLSQLLTGFIYPRSPMPPVVKAIGNLIPLTYFIRIMRGIVTKGIGLTFLWSDVLALAAYSAIVMGLAAVTFRKRLD
jgi:ABC-2 type transport system permease protein